MSQYEATSTEKKHQQNFQGVAGKTAKPDEEFYATPYSLTRALLRYESFVGSIWEPACGDGAICEVLHARYPDTELLASDKREVERKSCYSKFMGGIDFLNFLNHQRVDHIITNPPFSLATPFIVKAKKIARQKIAMLLKLDYLHGGERFDLVYADREFPLARVITFSRRPWLGGDPAVDRLDGQFSYAWFVFERGYGGEPRLTLHDNRSEASKAAAQKKRKRAEEAARDQVRLEEAQA